MHTRRRFLAQAAAASLATAAASPRSLLAEPSAAQLALDPLRPQFHLLPPGNWMNDPNGPIVWNGETHLFYQLNPHGPAWGDIHWGHAVSADLVHWRHLPVALSPTAGSSDQDGCWSGSALEHNGQCLAFYTGVVRAPREKATCKGDISYRETQNLAIASGPGLHTLVKQGRPILDSPPPGLEVTGFRDPAPFRLSFDPAHWYMAVGSGIVGKGGAVLLYRSADLHAWQYLHPLFEAPGNGKATPDPVDAGTMFECPDFFELDGQYVLLYSTERKVLWLTGTLDPTTLRFTPRARGLLDTGAFYAPKSMLHPTHGRILWGWITETRPEADYIRAGWAGCMALPRVLHVAPDGHLTQTVPDGLHALLGSASPIRKGSSVPSLAAKITGHLPASLSLRLSSGSAELATLQASADGRQVTLNGVALPYDPAVPLTLFVDGSVLELFLGDRAAHTARAYPQLQANAMLSLDLTSPGTTHDLTVAPVNPISPNRLTT